LVGRVSIRHSRRHSALLNDIWEFIPGALDSHSNGDIAGNFTGQWIWQGGSNIGNQSGVYGTQSVAAAGNIPGGRWAAATVTDPLAMFGCSAARVTTLPEMSAS